MDSDMPEPIVFKWNVLMEKELLKENLRNSEAGSIEEKVSDFIKNKNFKVKRLKDRYCLRNYDIEDEDKEIQGIIDGLCICQQHSCICHRKFPHPAIGDNIADEDDCPVG